MPDVSGDPYTDHDRETAKVLRAYFDGARLTTVPRAGRKRQVVLEHLVRQFEPGVHYAEESVNSILQAAHPDVAALRRHLVDAGLMDRAHGEYWRSGGWVDVS